MKIPEQTYINTEGSYVKIWEQTAAKLSMQYGIYVAVHINLDMSNTIKEIVFSVDTRQFNSLRELQKALRNRAFL